MFYYAYASAANSERGAAIFNDGFSGRYGCQTCHIDFGFTPNNGRYSDFGLVNKILYMMPPSDPSICGIQCAVDVMSYLRQADIPYDLIRADNPYDFRGSEWYGSRLLKLNGAHFEGNTSRQGADHCKTVRARWVTYVPEDYVRVVPEGGRACRY